MLSILYKYYAIFTKEFKETINHYIINYVFNQLFMHWNQQVRNLFHLLLCFKISKAQINNPENHGKLSLSMHEERSHHCELIMDNVNHLRDIKREDKKPRKPEPREYYLKMKDRLAEKRKKYILESRPSLESLDSLDISPIKSISNFSDNMGLIPPGTKRKWSVVSSHEYEKPVPTEQEMGYLSLIHI